MSEPVRLRILVMLTSGELCVCDIQRVLCLPQSTVSRHMSRLKLLGLVEDRRAGKWVHYRLVAGDSSLAAGIGEILRGLAETEAYAEDMKVLAEYLKGKVC